MMWPPYFIGHTHIILYFGNSIDSSLSFPSLFFCALRFDAHKRVLSNQTFQVFSEVESVVEQLPLIENKEGGRRAINRK